MDGSGRWAETRGLDRNEGYSAASCAIASTILAAADLGVKSLYLYSLSTDNARRPPDSIRVALDFAQWLWPREVLDVITACGGSAEVIGDMSRADILESVETLPVLEKATESALTVYFLINYGSREEIALAARAYDQGLPEGNDSAILTFSRSLQTNSNVDLDLLIRTAGEQRLSNFMLWQASYAELVFTDTLWPDFRRCHLFSCVGEFQRRRRNFGLLPNEAQS